MMGVILAGGQSTRFGGDAKGLRLLRGLPLVGHAHAALSMACRDIAIECVPGAGYEGWGVPCIAARAEHAGKGPLAGMLAGLERAGDHDTVAFVPCDMPLVSPLIHERLAQVAGGAWAISPLGDEPLVCVLPVGLRAALDAALSGPKVPRVVDVLAGAGAVGVRFAEDWPFVNVNTPEDLARLEASF